MTLQSPVKSLDHFLGDLRRASKAQEHYLLNVLFQLQFPEAEGGIDPGFNAEEANSFAQWLSGNYEEAVEQSVFLKRLKLQQSALNEMAASLLDKAVKKQLEPDELAGFLRAIQRFHELSDQLRAEVTSSLIELDELTELFNRNVMERDLAEEMAHSFRSGRSFAVAMLDIDHFKKVNDKHGHAFGDKVLIALAERIEDSLRPYDRVYRYGGEEFLVLLQDTSLDSAKRVLERLREVVAAQEMGDAKLTLPVTVSIGVVDSLGFDDTDKMIEAADAALYKAKEKGRNRVELASREGR